MTVRTWLSLRAAWLALVSAPVVHAQAPGMQARLDTLAERMLLTRHPCPSPVPPSWIAADSANGTGVRCSLILSAARGAEQAMATRPRREMDPWSVLCVVLTPAESLRSIGAMWRVAFYTDSLRGAEIYLDEKGRRAVAIRMVVDLGAPLKSACKPAV